MKVKKTLVFAVRFFLLLTLVFALSSNQAFPQNQEKSEGNSTFLFLIDTSLSMREGNRLGRVGEEVMATIKSWIEEGLIKDGDNLKIKQFDTEVYSVGSWVYTAEEKKRIVAQINDRLRRLRPRGKTDIGRAALVALEKLKKQEAVFIIMLTDGEDTVSRKDLSEILEIFREYYKGRRHGFFYISLGIRPHETVGEMVEGVGGRIYETPEEIELKGIIQEITDIIEEVVEVYLRLEPDRANFGQIDPGKYSPLESFTLSTNFTDISYVSIGRAELQHPKGYKIPEENIIISPEKLEISSNVPAEFKIKLKIPEEAIAGEYSGKVTFEIKETSTTLAIRVSVSPWLKITGNPVDFGEVRAGKESEDKPFTLTSNLPELAEVTVKKYDLIDNKGHKILKDNVIISPERLRVSAAFPQRFSLRVKVPEGTPEGKYEGKISFLMGEKEKILPVRVKVIPFPAVTLLPISPDKPLRHQPLRIMAKLTPPESEILEIPIEVTYPDATLHPLILRREQKGIFSNKGEEFKPTKIGEHTFAIQPSKDYQIKNGRQQIKVTPPTITISPKSANFGKLKKGEERRASFTLRAEKGRIFGPEPLHITISGAKDYLQQIGIADKVSLSLNKPLVTLSPAYLSDSFELTLKSPQQLSWRAYSTNLIVNRPGAEAKEVSLTIKGPFPWRIFSITAIALIGIYLFYLFWKSITQPPPVGKQFKLRFEKLNTVKIGRGWKGDKGKNNIQLWDDSVSLCHAEIIKKENEVKLTQIEGSLFLNGERIKEGVLSSGNEIGIGKFIFKFIIEKENEAKLIVTKSPL